MTGPVPEWFSRAIDTPYREGTIEVAGTPIHYLDWGDPGLPGIVLVHGTRSYSYHTGGNVTVPFLCESPA